MNDRFVNKNKEYVEEINGVKFTLKPLHWGDRGKLASIMRQLYKPLFKINDILSDKDLSEEDKGKLVQETNHDSDFEYLNDEQIKITDGILRKYVVKIDGCDIPLEDVQYKESDVLAIMDALLKISNMKEDESKNLPASSSSK